MILMSSCFKLLLFSMTLALFAAVSFAQESTPSPSATPAPSPTPVTIVVDGQKRSSIKLFKGQSISLRVTDPAIKLSSSDNNIFTITPEKDAQIRNLIISANAIDGAHAQIKATVGNDDSPRDVNSNGGIIEVTAYALPKVTSSTLKLNQTKSLIEIFDLKDREMLNQLEIKTDPNVIEFDGNNFTGNKISNNAEITYQAKGTSTPILKQQFQVESNVSRIEISSTNKSFVAYAGSTFTLNARAKDESGNDRQQQTDQIEWSINDDKKDANDAIPSESVILMKKGHGEVDVYVLKPFNDPIMLTAKIDGDEKSARSYRFFAKGEQNIIGFSNIEMRLNLMDNRTAKDLFGSVAANDYMVAKLRIFNQVPKDQNGGPSSSILFFSEGLEVNVSLEKRPQEKTKNSGKPEWNPLDLDDVEYINNWVYVPLADDQLIKYFVTREQLKCTDDLKKIIGRESCQLSAAEVDRLWYFYEKTNCDKDGKNECYQVSRKNWIPFRPYAFLVIASTHDRRSERSKRERILTGANALSGLASFATAFASSGNNSGVIFGLDKYSNLLVPAFEKLFPSRREVERKNILDMTLQPVEEVPFGKEVSKIVFIPRKVIEGILPGYDVRISSVSVSKIKAEASIVNKEKIENR